MLKKRISLSKMLCNSVITRLQTEKSVLLSLTLDLKKLRLRQSKSVSRHSWLRLPLSTQISLSKMLFNSVITWSQTEKDVLLSLTRVLQKLRQRQSKSVSKHSRLRLPLSTQISLSKMLFNSGITRSQTAKDVLLSLTLVLQKLRQRQSKSVSKHNRQRLPLSMQRWLALKRCMLATEKLSWLSVSKR